MKRVWMAACVGVLFAASAAFAMPKWKPEEGDLVRLESAVLDSVLYESEAKVLVVTFRSGASYEYYGVSETVFQGLLKAAEKGKYYNENIRGAYESHRIEDWAAADGP